MAVLEQAIEQEKRIFVFLGETGSGKSEIAVNWAMKLAGRGKKVRFFDMDQTKPLFRSRELIAQLQARQVVMDTCSQLLDAPTVPDAVFDRLQEPDMYTVLDVGGNAVGARCIGQYAAAWGAGAAVYMVMNCYRPWSGNRDALLRNWEEIIAAARVKDFKVISNPNFGAETTPEDVVAGHGELEMMLIGTPHAVAALAVQKAQQDIIRRRFPDVDIFGLTRYIKAPWEEKDE